MFKATTELQYLKYDGPNYTNDEWPRRIVPVFRRPAFLKLPSAMLARIAAWHTAKSVSRCYAYVRVPAGYRLLSPGAGTRDRVRWLMSLTWITSMLKEERD